MLTQIVNVWRPDISAAGIHDPSSARSRPLAPIFSRSSLFCPGAKVRS